MTPDETDRPTDPEAVVGESVELTVIARRSGVELIHVEHYVELGLLEPRPAGSSPPRFAPTGVSRVARAERLRHDLELNHAGAVVVSELLDRIAALHERLRRA